ncbi:MAG: hypothetical protein ABWY02_07095, partial [Telluria sp.]
SEGTAQEAGARETGARTTGAPGKRQGGMPAPQPHQIAANAKRKPERPAAGGRAVVAAPERARPTILATIKTKPKAPRK